MKCILFFVSLCLASCSLHRTCHYEYCIVRHKNSLYITDSYGGRPIKVAEGKLQIDFFKKNVDVRDKSLIRSIRNHYEANALDVSDAIFYIQNKVGGKNWTH